MATVHLGRLLGPVGFSRTVAIKRLHAQFASDPEFVSMFLDEARLAARIRHPNVVPTLDVVATGGELFLVMDYVPGESTARIARALREKQQSIPLRILSSIIAGVLHGLHSAHEAKDERGHPLGIVHRDVSPQNVLVGTDGVARVLDFGVAKAAGRMQTTKEGQIKGKLSYMPPEQLRGAAVSRQTDIYAAGVMLWELITGQRLFAGENEGAIVGKVLEGRVERPSQILMMRRQTLTDSMMRQLEALDETVLHALAMQPEDRFQTAREMAIEIERKCPPATASEVADWLESVAREVLDSRAQMVAEIESSASHHLQGDHVASVLNAKSTLHGPGTGIVSAPSSGRPISRGPFPYPSEGPPVTQPSSISVATGTGGRPSDNRKTALIVFAGIMLSSSVLVSALVYRQAAKRPASEANADPAPPTTTGVVQEDAVPSTADAGLVLSPIATTPPTTAPPPPPQIRINKGGAVKTPPKPPQTTAAAPTPPPIDDCATPYWYDAQGVKHYKPQCLTPK
jgi:serine/threonine-protein kinase